MYRFAVAFVLLSLLFTAAAQATTIVLPTDAQLIAKTPVIVEGTVHSTRAVDRAGAIWTETSIDVTRTLRGDVSGSITVAEIGGEVGDRVTKVFGSPEFNVGEHVLLFLAPERGELRTVDLFVGKFTRGTTEDGRELWLRSDSDQPVRLVDGSFRPLKLPNMQRDAAGFETFVRDRVRGAAGNFDYFIENPALARAPRSRNSGELGGISADFTLIGEPTVYRWFMFDRGEAAQWVSHGTQPGYGDGGISEVKTALSAWTGYAGAKILYSYAGAASGSPAGLSRTNGVNEVLLNDPLSEITGTFNSSTGGVVGQGGFNGVRSGGNWTAPFAADAAHPGGTLRAIEIVEANLTIQDGVSPANRISSTRLAEIVSHEFGHTLGFGHSDDGTALMYSSVTGAGPSLRADDQLAARWLYPSGIATPQPQPLPAAPSGLTATLSGSNITLQWNDNATNETLQSIYTATASGTFGKSGDVGAGVKSATLSGFGSGSYRFYVTASNSGGESAASNIATITIGGTVSAAFSFTPQLGTAGTTTFTFYDESTGSVTSRLWNFGDGATSTSAVATHLYTKSGQYPVTLTVYGSGGTQSQTTRTVTVDAAPAASFSWSPAAPTTDDNIAFYDQSSGGVTSWQWSFGDGGTSQAQNPVRRFAQPGNWTVTLTVYRNGQSASTSRSVSVVAATPALPPVEARFDMSSTTATAAAPVSFTDRSTGTPTSWSWSFGDGSTSTAQSPVHTFAAAGTYNVTLTARNALTSSTTSRTMTILPQVHPFRSLVSVTTQTVGVGGTTWRTELSIFNAGDGTSVDLVFIPGAGGAVLTRSLYLGARQSLTYGNTALDLFGLSTGAGALAIEASSTSSTPQLKVSSRTYTGGMTGTYGQSVPDVAGDGMGSTLYLTGIQSNAAFRTNVGIVNRSDATVNTTLALVDAAGNTIATTQVNVAPRNFQQAALATYFPQTAGRSYDVLSMNVTAAASGAISVYASVVDNRTQDPVYIQGTPARSDASLVIPAVGRSAGANGTYWRSDVTMYNPTSSRLGIVLKYLVAGADNRNPTTRTLAIEPRQTTTLADVLAQMGIESGTGALELSWFATSGPVVTSRTYTTTSGSGTYGQSIDPVGAFATEVAVPGLRSDSEYRSNVGFVNSASTPMTVRVQLLAAAGYEIASTWITLAPKSQVQYAVTSLFPSIGTSAGSFTMSARGDVSGALFAYASMVDNGSGDPVFFAGR